AAAARPPPPAEPAAAAGLELPPLSDATRDAIAAELPWYAGVGNPLDYNTALWGLEEPLTRVFTAALGEGADVGMLVIAQPPAELGISEETGFAIRARERASAATGVPV